MGKIQKALKGLREWPDGGMTIHECTVILEREISRLIREVTNPIAVNIVFDGPPEHEPGRFVEVENDAGASVSVGTWIQKDEFWVLRITMEDLQALALKGKEVEPGELICKCNCPCCGASLTVEHGDDPGEISVLGESRREAREVYIVRLEPGVWLDGSDGDPGRTLIEENAKRFFTLDEAYKAIDKAREYRLFKDAIIWIAKPPSPLCPTCGGRRKVPTGNVFLSDPPQTEYEPCPTCNETEKHGGKCE